MGDFLIIMVSLVVGVPLVITAIKTDWAKVARTLTQRRSALSKGDRELIERAISAAARAEAASQDFALNAEANAEDIKGRVSALEHFTGITNGGERRIPPRAPSSALDVELPQHIRRDN